VHLDILMISGGILA